MLHCSYCKGKHASDSCLWYLKSLFTARAKQRVLPDSFSSSSPTPFVGRFGYPKVRVGLLSPGEERDDVWLYDAPRVWSAKSFQIGRIVDFRTSLVNAEKPVGIKEEGGFVALAREVAMADKPVSFDVELKGTPSTRIVFDGYHAPTGPRAEVKAITISSNPSIPTRVDKVVSDIDWKASDALGYLYAHGFDETWLSRLLSVGTLGVKKYRRLVPTRWSITATDDMLGKQVMQEVKDFKIGDCQAFFGGYLGNFYVILLFPGEWGFELFEIYLPGYEKTKKLEYATDYEGFEGRKAYAQECTGGYYTVRLAVLEKLKDVKRQAKVIAIRVITSEYTVPLGVWVTREAARKAVSSPSIEFGDKDLLVEYARIVLLKKFGLNGSELIKKSKLLNQPQRKLSGFT